MIGRALDRIPGRRPNRDRAGPRLAISPACWGISEAPGWGHQLDTERVLSDVWSLGLGSIDAGPPGFLPDRSDLVRPLLRRHWLRVISGHAHAVLHDHDIRGPELAHIDGHASWLAAVGAHTLVLTAIHPRDSDADHGIVLSSSGWAHLLHLIGSVEHVCARHGLKLAVLPRLGSMIQGPSDIERFLVGTEAGLCLDVGHLLLVGADPMEVLEIAAGRIQHVRLNDIDSGLAKDVRESRVDYPTAVSRGLFKAMGTGDAHIERVVEALQRTRFRGWYALDFDVRLASEHDDPLETIKYTLAHVRPLVS